MSEKMISQAEQKALVGKVAIDSLIEKGLIFSGMKIGLGTGSTAMPAVSRLAERIKDGTLKDIKAVATSFQTSIACEELGIPVFSMNAKEIGGKLDLAIDGADEINPDKQLIKGGGAALLLEKIVAYNAKTFVIVADSSKTVPSIGTKFALPVEIIAEARTSVFAALQNLGASCTLRQGVKKAGPVITDNGNLIADIVWQTPPDAAKMESEINKIVGVVENGFFTANKPIVYVAQADGTVKEF
ncbi:MAG: ribose-5-phosphate isomerase RpiA [Treponemataceae bacterium]|nr:ribose-5-phosphate isomerase RpiA [Treponemataceae bacterium]